MKFAHGEDSTQFKTTKVNNENQQFKATTPKIPTSTSNVIDELYQMYLLVKIAHPSYNSSYYEFVRDCVIDYIREHPELISFQQQQNSRIREVIESQAVINKFSK